MAYKARSITSKASSACKINMGLVQGEADVQNSKAFVNYGELVEKKIAGGGGETTSEAAKDKAPESKGQADAAVDIPEGGEGSTSTSTTPSSLPTPGDN